MQRQGRSSSNPVKQIKASKIKDKSV
jgi:G2/mitotic-specific cyclin-B, other